MLLSNWRLVFSLHQLTNGDNDLTVADQEFEIEGTQALISISPSFNRVAGEMIPTFLEFRIADFHTVWLRTASNTDRMVIILDAQFGAKELRISGILARLACEKMLSASFYNMVRIWELDLPIQSSTFEGHIVRHKNRNIESRDAHDRNLQSVKYTGRGSTYKPLVALGHMTVPHASGALPSFTELAAEMGNGDWFHGPAEAFVHAVCMRLRRLVSRVSAQEHEWVLTEFLKASKQDQFRRFTTTLWRRLRRWSMSLGIHKLLFGKVGHGKSGRWQGNVTVRHSRQSFLSVPRSSDRTTKLRGVRYHPDRRNEILLQFSPNHGIVQMLWSQPYVYTWTDWAPVILQGLIIRRLAITTYQGNRRYPFQIATSCCWPTLSWKGFNAPLVLCMQQLSAVMTISIIECITKSLFRNKATRAACRTCLTRYHTHVLHYSLIRHSSYLVQYIVSLELYRAPQTLQYTHSTLFGSRSLVESFAICPLLSSCKSYEPGSPLHS
ncbi:uncharacterized protein BDR25DRAFT_363365 [Lindgomyces ingoldianus]|uniref:Uncharacterized protein n=1 Tax=Lindgomyces ingoldianus TaxID=673940 RepID=A0ACB6Q7N7_9PLEO|nr:uncharacterized protein BDR25DRAFT_363365 [Lindgomyces ingoldianus]KAF2462943.1 hypothetical protein BDR25DRAFT_363365 [Lindgomyces ingoldianus]